MAAFFTYVNIYIENEQINTYYNMNKKLIKLTESDLHKIVKESVDKILNEIDYSQIPVGDYYERNKWFKQQVDNDYPNHGIEPSQTNPINWQEEYQKLTDEEFQKQRKNDMWFLRHFLCSKEGLKKWIEKYYGKGAKSYDYCDRLAKIGAEEYGIDFDFYDGQAYVY